MTRQPPRRAVCGFAARRPASGSVPTRRAGSPTCTGLEEGRWGCQVGAASPSDSGAMIVVRPRDRPAACDLPRLAASTASPATSTRAADNTPIVRTSQPDCPLGSADCTGTFQGELDRPHAAADLSARRLAVHPAPRPQGDPRPVRPGRRGPAGGHPGRQRHRHPAHAGHLLPRPALLRGGIATTGRKG